MALIGATIAIHAAKKLDSDMAGTVDSIIGSTLPAGCIVCTARLDAAFRLGNLAEGTAVPAASVVERLTSRNMPECFTVRIDRFGDYSPGRWAWLLRDVVALTPPVPAVGRQGFFEWTRPN